MATESAPKGPVATKDAMGPVGRVLGVIATISLWVAAICMVAMAFLVTISVISRFFFGNPMTALFEFSEYAILAVTMLAAPLLVRTDMHIKMDLLSEFLGKDHRLVRITDWFVAVLVLVISATLVWFTVRTAMNDFVRGAVTSTYLAPPRWPLTTLMAVGSIGVFLEALRRLVALPTHRAVSVADPEEPTAGV